MIHEIRHFHLFAGLGGGAYCWLKHRLGMETQPHIGFMDADECRRVVSACKREAVA